jgi:hypothetical protein
MCLINYQNILTLFNRLIYIHTPDIAAEQKGCVLFGHKIMCFTLQSYTFFGKNANEIVKNVACWAKCHIFLGVGGKTG